MFGAPSEEGDADSGLATELEGERRAHDRRQAATDDGIGAHVAALDVVKVHRAAVPVRAAFELPVELCHQLVWRRPLREGVPVRPVARSDDVVLLEGAADPDGDGLLTDRDV